jgi:hypothetical protein
MSRLRAIACAHFDVEEFLGGLCDGTVAEKVEG